MICCDIVLDWRYLVGQTSGAVWTASELRDEFGRVVYVDVHMAEDSCMETSWHEFLYELAISGIFMAWSFKRSSEQCPSMFMMLFT